MRDLAEWLEALGLGEYAEAFAENRIDFGVLPRLTGDDLKDIGVVAVGDRRKLLDAIAALSKPDMGPGEGEVEEAGPTNEWRSEAERRQLTVMFCDLVGSTALSAGLDPEDMREVISAYQNAVVGEIDRYEGHVAKFMGDGVLAYFGWPKAHEDEAERAVRAGLAVIEAVSRLTAPTGDRLAARIGIATGLVVVGDLVGEGAAQEEAVVGDTPNLAARLQERATPNSVVISPSTMRLIGALFEAQDLGYLRLKGLPEPVRAWRVIGEQPSESRFEATHATGLTPFIGRDQEIDLLLHRWELAKNGEGQVVL
jgi:class 3 adenylate cyclase